MLLPFLLLSHPQKKAKVTPPPRGGSLCPHYGAQSGFKLTVVLLTHLPSARLRV